MHRVQCKIRYFLVLRDTSIKWDENERIVWKQHALSSLSAAVLYNWLESLFPAEVAPLWWMSCGISVSLLLDPVKSKTFILPIPSHLCLLPEERLLVSLGHVRELGKNCSVVPVVFAAFSTVHEMRKGWGCTHASRWTNVLLSFEVSVKLYQNVLTHLKRCVI